MRLEPLSVSPSTFRDDEDGIQLNQRDLENDVPGSSAARCSERCLEGGRAGEASTKYASWGPRPPQQPLASVPPSDGWLSPAVLNILAVETAERFSYFGFRAILVLYFTQSLQYGETTAIAYFAYTTCWAYLSPLAGALLADGPWGRYRTILRFGIIYVVGLLILTVGAGLGSSNDRNDGGSNLETRRALSFAGLFLTCLGTGGIKPCVSAFGADQVAHQRQQWASPRLRGDDPDQQLELRESSDLAANNEDESGKVTLSEALATGNSNQLQAYFAFFYMAINVGATASIAVIPVVRQWGGFGTAFGVSLLCMVTAVVLFWSRNAEYVHETDLFSSPDEREGSQSTNCADESTRRDSSSPSLAETFRLCGWLIHSNLWLLLPEYVTCRIQPVRPRSTPFPAGAVADVSEAVTRGRHHLVPTVDEDERRESSKNVHATESEACRRRRRQEQDQQKLRDAAQAVYVLPILAMFPVFWCLYDQQSSVWTLQATRMDTGRLQPEQLNVVNPVEIMVLVPLFDRVIYPWLKNRHHVDLRPLRRMGWGMVLAALSFFTSAMLEYAIQQRATMVAAGGSSTASANTISVWWQLPQITILSLAEIFLSVTGLEFAYATSPNHLKAFLMSLYLLTTALGDMLGGVLYSSVFSSWSMTSAMTTCGALMLLNWLVFLRVSAWWESHDASSLLLSRLPTSVVQLPASHGDED